MKGNEDGEPNEEVQEVEVVEGGADEAEPEGVDVGGERAEVAGDVEVEGFAFGEHPRGVELMAEVDEKVRPREPREAEGGGGEEGIEEPLGEAGGAAAVEG